VIFFYLWRSGLLRRTDGEKIRFFFGATGNTLFLSRRMPLVASVSWPRAMLQPSYARSVVSWLAYRADLYDGHQG
jgi:hypothetical protein